jgi:LuxR family maltose regulon positive regulatory protein
VVDGAGTDEHAPPAPPSLASPLLRAKLRTPAPAEHFVRRPRLDELLDDLTRLPLTLVVAPAGSGKSAMVSGWATQARATTAWLSLDESDRDPTQLWSGIVAALEGALPGCTGGALTLLRRGAGPDVVVHELLNELDGASEAPVVLVLDDVYLVDDVDELVSSLGSFLQHLPGWLHAVVLSRRQPILPVDRLRARGQLGEVHFVELRLSTDEATEMLGLLAPRLTSVEVDEAIEGMDGWAAGLQMAALAARASRARRDVGPDDGGRAVLVDDFVWHEVLALEADELVQVLLDVSVVDRVSGGLAEALTGRSDAALLLEQAEARGLFVTRLGVDGWFELHRLVRSALLAESARRAPAGVARQHERAAGWYEAQGEPAAALDHWLLAGRPREALRALAGTHAQLYDDGREATVQRVLQAIPTAVATADIDAMLEYAWCQLLVSRTGFAEAIEHAAWMAAGDEVDDLSTGRLRMLQASTAVVHADWTAGAQHVRESLELLGGGWRHDWIGRFAWNLLSRDVALGERWDDDGEEVLEIERALALDPERRLALEGSRAVGLVLAGRPLDALQAVAGIRRASVVSNMSILRTEVALAEALAHRELGDEERAMAQLRALADEPTEAMVYSRLLAMLAVVASQASAGDVAAAQADLDRASDLVRTARLGSGGQDWLARAGVLVATADGDARGVQRWASQVQDPFWRAIGGARALLAAGDRAGAEDELRLAEPRCVRHEVSLGLVRAQALTDPDEAAKSAVAAFEVATAHGMLKTVADEGPAALELLERAAWRAPEAWLDRLRRVVAASGRRAPSASHPELLEPLTERERDVLRFLPSRLTTREIADELYVSVNTLKFHLKVIYRKLGVSSRAEAAEKARRMSS